MCGIVGYNGNQQAAPILLKGLEKLEYRGYDSAGLSVRNGTSDTEIVKAKGRLKALAEKTDDGKAMKGTIGIGHTRWATHGEPSEKNAHPHCSDDHNVIGVHNGIIENYQELKEKLLHHGYTFYSQTDTEVAVKLIDYYEKKYNQGPLYSLTHAMQRIRGSYALAVMFKNYPDTIYAARKDSPMVIGIAEGASYLASDVTPILNYTKTVYFIGNEQVAELNKGSVKFFNLDQEEVEIEPKEVTWDAEAAEKNGYEHFMIKEIHEQPKAVKDTLKSVIKDGKIDLSEVGIDKETAEKLNNIIIVACGSAYHVGVVGQYVIESASRIPVRVELASEFRYRDPIMNENDLVIVISQSGETADSLAALRLAKKMNIKTLGIVNVVGSSIAREADYVFYTLAIQLGKYREIIDENRYTSLIEEMETLPEKMERVLSDKERIQWFASKYANAQDMYFIGRGIDYAVSLEGSLKMKEISYVHSEAYAAGEIKHGPISLIEDGTLVIGICTDKKLFEKTRSNMVEVKSRGAYLMGLTSYGNYSIEDTADFTVYIPQTDPYFTTSLAIIPLQLLGYYLSVAKGLNVDKPRNLAKSVTVE